jgi:H+/gluconate symporter-like permease
VAVAAIILTALTILEEHIQITNTTWPNTEIRTGKRRIPEEHSFSAKLWIITIPISIRLSDIIATVLTKPFPQTDHLRHFQHHQESNRPPW